MSLLCLSLLIVYIVWYQVQWANLKNLIASNRWWTGIHITTSSWDELTISDIIASANTWTNTWDSQSSIASSQPSNTSGSRLSNMFKTWTTLSSPNTWNTITVQASTWIHMLSGTSIYYGPIEIIEKLWIKYQYALVDTSWTFFINLGVPSYDFKSIMRTLKWTTFEIVTEQDMTKNKLFGDKVIFLNLPQYQNKKVSFLLYIHNEVWLLHMDYALYHKSKAYLKSLFTY